MAVMPSPTSCDMERRMDILDAANSPSGRIGVGVKGHCKFGRMSRNEADIGRIPISAIK